MNIINLNGGLGNQLFQYSFGMAMKYVHGIDVKFCDTFVNPQQLKIQDIFDISLPLANINDFKNTIGGVFLNEYLRDYSLRLMRKLGLKEFGNFIIENYKYPLSSLPMEQNKFFYGYWQNYNFFYNSLLSIKKDLKIKNFEITANYFNKFYDQYSNIVCLHLRLGDYKHKKNLNVYSEIPIGYYQNAISLFEKKLSKPLFILFSDQLEKVDKSFFKKNIIPSSSIVKKSKDDFSIMSNCDCFILSNSTFSLWAAYLSNKKNIYVTKPNSWFKDKNIEKANKYYPKDWSYLY